LPTEDHLQRKLQLAKLELASLAELERREKARPPRSTLVEKLYGRFKIKPDVFVVHANSAYTAKEREIAELNAAIDWRRMRTSEPKCLSCGSTRVMGLNLTSADGNGQTVFSHPGCGGSFFETPSTDRIALNRSRRVYSVDGDLLTEEPEQRRQLSR
jgi:hypothetical protein